VNSLLNDQLKSEFDTKTRAEYARLREEHSAKTREKKLLTLAQARANRTSIDWSNYVPPKSEWTGPRTFRPSIVDLRNYIDWSPFFHVWELRGRYPAIFDDPVIGKQARELFDDAQNLLDEIIGKNLLTVRGVFGFWPANCVGDDVDLYTDETRAEKLATFYFLRQQIQKPAGQANHCLADFVAPSLVDHVAPGYPRLVARKRGDSGVLHGPIDA
jgi:5-methyltetrahydrofolate--homocysteine methyltransferase